MLLIAALKLSFLRNAEKIFFPQGRRFIMQFTVKQNTESRCNLQSRAMLLASRSGDILTFCTVFCKRKLLQTNKSLECLGRLIPLRSFSKREALVPKGDETAFGGRAYHH